MNIEFIPKIASIPKFSQIYYINLSETIKTDVVLMFLKKSAQETDFIELTDETSSDEQILVICDRFEETDAFFKEHEQFQSAHILLTDTLFKPTSAQQLLEKTDWYVLREIERRLFDENHHFRVFRDSLRSDVDA